MLFFKRTYYFLGEPWNIFYGREFHKPIWDCNISRKKSTTILVERLLILNNLLETNTHNISRDGINFECHYYRMQPMQDLTKFNKIALQDKDLDGRRTRKQ